MSVHSRQALFDRVEQATSRLMEVTESCVGGQISRLDVLADGFIAVTILKSCHEEGLLKTFGIHAVGVRIQNLCFTCSPYFERIERFSVVNAGEFFTVVIQLETTRIQFCAVDCAILFRRSPISGGPIEDY